MRLFLHADDGAVAVRGALKIPSETGLCASAVAAMQLGRNIGCIKADAHRISVRDGRSEHKTHLQRVVRSAGSHEGRGRR